MEFVRQIINSNLLDKIELPLSLKNKMVEIIVLPVDERIEKAVHEKTIDDFAGIFEKIRRIFTRSMPEISVVQRSEIYANI